MTAPSSPVTLHSLLQECDSIEAYLESVHGILAERHMPNIANLKIKVAQFCTNVQKAPPELQRGCSERLKNLLDKLDTCQAEMKTFYDTFLNNHP